MTLDELPKHLASASPTRAITKRGGKSLERDFVEGR
jgi:hypothetical protein